MMKRILLSCLLFVVTQTHAGLRTLIIDGGQVAGLPIAVMPFALKEAENTAFEDMAEVIRKDLQISGQFKVLAETNTGVDNRVVGDIQKSGPNVYTVHFELLNALQQKGKLSAPPLLSVRFDNIQPQAFRGLAHHISDLIFQKLIGIRGIFSSRIAYVAVTKNGHQLQRTLEVADYDGQNSKPLYRSFFPLMSLNWSPDGKKIAFVSFEKERSSVNVVELATGRVERITQFPGLNSAPAWSPDGRTLALVLSKDGSPKIYLIDLASKHLRSLTSGIGIDTEPHFAPDGRSLVFTSDRGGKPQIYRVTLNTGKVERLTFQGSYNAKPSLTPDGKNLVTLHRTEEGLFSIAVHNLETGAVRVLTQTGLNDSPTLAPNGMMVLYGMQESGQGMLGAVTLDGRLKIRLPAKEGNVQEPAWSPFTRS